MAVEAEKQRAKKAAIVLETETFFIGRFPLWWWR
jgi:hypothetical protein